MGWLAGRNKRKVFWKIGCRKSKKGGLGMHTWINEDTNDKRRTAVCIENDAMLGILEWWRVRAWVLERRAKTGFFPVKPTNLEGLKTTRSESWTSGSSLGKKQSTALDAEKQKMPLDLKRRQKQENSRHGYWGRAVEHCSLCWTSEDEDVLPKQNEVEEVLTKADLTKRSLVSVRRNC